MTERPRIDGVDEAELEAITREIHAQLRASNGLPPEPGPPPVAEPAAPPSSATMARFVGGFLLPPLAMMAFLLLLRLVKDGF